MLPRDMYLQKMNEYGNELVYYETVPVQNIVETSFNVFATNSAQLVQLKTPVFHILFQ